MAVFLMILGAIAVGGAYICVYAAGVWQRRARWLAEAPVTPIASAAEGKVIRVTGRALPTGLVGPLSGRDAAIWRVDVFESGRSHNIEFSEGALAIADGSGATAMMEASAAHLLFIEQKEVAKLQAKGAPTPEVKALCQRLGLTLEMHPRNWYVEAQERIVAPDTTVYAIGQVRIEGKTVWLTAAKDVPESCFATQDPRAFQPRPRKFRLIGAVFFVTGLALILLGVRLLD